MPNGNRNERYTMVGEKRLYAAISAVKYIEKNNIKGDIVECGVWKGGNLILCQKYLNLQNVNIKIHGFDNFEGMVKPKEIDADYRNVPSSEMHSLFKNLPAQLKLQPCFFSTILSSSTWQSIFSSFILITFQQLLLMIILLEYQHQDELQLQQKINCQYEDLYYDIETMQIVKNLVLLKTLHHE